MEESDRPCYVGQELTAGRWVEESIHSRYTQHCSVQTHTVGCERVYMRARGGGEGGIRSDLSKGAVNCKTHNAKTTPSMRVVFEAGGGTGSRSLRANKANGECIGEVAKHVAILSSELKDCRVNVATNSASLQPLFLPLSRFLWVTLSFFPHSRRNWSSMPFQSISAVA